MNKDYSQQRKISACRYLGRYFKQYLLVTPAVVVISVFHSDYY